MFSDNKQIKKLLAAPIFLDATSAKDILIFRRTIEAAMKLGYWGGFVGQG